MHPTWRRLLLVFRSTVILGQADMAETGIGLGAIRNRAGDGGSGNLDDLDRCRSETQHHEPAGTSRHALSCVEFLLAGAPTESTDHLAEKEVPI